MSETLTIRNFGPIKDINLDLRKFNVIIGENATGKSTIAKMLAVCRYFSYIIVGYMTGENFEQGLQDWGLTDFVKDDSFIRYECDHYIFSARRIIDKKDYSHAGEILSERALFETEIMEISDKFKNLKKEFDIINPNSKEGYGYADYDWKIPRSFFQNDVASLLDNPFFLPTERGLQSIFSLGKSSIQNISDSLFNQLANLDLVAKNFKNAIKIDPLNILYKNDNGHGYIRKNNEDRFYSLYNGASGYKSAIPIVLVIKYYNEIRNKTKTFLIEEPELNLFPKTQRQLVKYLVANTVNIGSDLLLTTHSPYILTSLNNLMYAHQVGQNFELETNKIIDKKYWMNPEDVSAYILNPDGTIEDILNKEESLINAEKIDEVSSKLNKEFNELIDIEIANASEIT